MKDLEKYLDHGAIVEDSVSRAEIRFWDVVNRMPKHDILARVIGGAALVMGGIAIGVGIVGHQAPDYTERFKQYDERLKSQQTQLAVIKGEEDQILKSPTLQKEKLQDCMVEFNKYYRQNPWDDAAEACKKG